VRFHLAFLKANEMKNVKFSALLALVVMAMGQAQAALPTALEPAITAMVTDILALIGIAGLAFISVAGGGVLWNLGAKFLKRVGGKA